MTDAVISEAKEAFELCQERESENREAYKSDIEFARLEQQWPAKVRQERELEGRPCLTINKLAAFSRQVVNDARQNKPGIIVHPVDGEADPETAEIFNGLIRNIEQSSNAEVAYDTALACAVDGGFGYFRINTAYSSDDGFEQDLIIEPIPDPLCVYGDPFSTAADSADWDTAFVVDRVTKDQFEKKYKGAEAVNWSGYEELDAPWFEDDCVLTAEYWRREETTKKLLALSDGMILYEDEYKKNKEIFDALGATVVGQPREVRSHKVVQRIISGAEELEKVDWAGKYIPIIPVYGDVINLDGKRHFRSMIRGAKDAQRMFNYWRTQATELVALAPKAPFIGRKGAFETDAQKWATANTQSHAYIEYDGADPPQRQPFSGIPAGALQEALNASDDMKAIIGLYDPSLGARSNETSGKAIMARQREGDVSTFHYIDNLSRAIRHAGRILIDLIPKVYSVPRVVRVLGPDGKADMKTVNEPFKAPVLDENGQPVQEEVQGPDGQVTTQVKEIEKIYDLTAGKYDLTVKSGPSFTSQREEFVATVTELIRAFPEAAPVLGDMLIKNMDFPMADEVGERLKALSPQTGPNPQADMVKQQAGAAITALDQEMQKLHAQLQATQQQLEQAQADSENKARELEIKAFDAETKRIQALKPDPLPSPAYEQ